MPRHLPMPRKITLRMQQIDIDTSICNSRQYCAIAQTIYRQLQLPIGRVRVTGAGVTMAKDEHRYYYKCPEVAYRLVRKIDQGEKVEPIIFNLRFTHRNKICPIDPARKHQVNQKRRERTAILAAQGLKPKVYAGRYGI